MTKPSPGAPAPSSTFARLQAEHPEGLLKTVLHGDEVAVKREGLHRDQMRINRAMAHDAVMAHRLLAIVTDLDRQLADARFHQHRWADQFHETEAEIARLREQLAEVDEALNLGAHWTAQHRIQMSSYLISDDIARDLAKIRTALARQEKRRKERE